MHSSALARTHGQMENWRDKGENKAISISLKNMCQTPNYAQILMKFFCMISSLLHLLLEEAHSKKKKKKSDLPVNKLSLVAMFPPPPPPSKLLTWGGFLTHMCDTAKSRQDRLPHL